MFVVISFCFDVAANVKQKLLVAFIQIHNQLKSTLNEISFFVQMTKSENATKHMLCSFIFCFFKLFVFFSEKNLIFLQYKQSSTVCRNKETFFCVSVRIRFCPNKVLDLHILQVVHTTFVVSISFIRAHQGWCECQHKSNHYSNIMLV